MSANDESAAIKAARAVFENLKTESLLIGRNVATRSTIAARAKISRTNFYTQKHDGWRRLCHDIQTFRKEYREVLKEHKKSGEKVDRKLLTEEKKKYHSMADQNLSLLKEIANKNEEIAELKKILNYKEERISSAEKVIRWYRNKYGGIDIREIK